MDILRNLFGNVTSGIIRLAVTVGVLAAAYFFIVKPVLKTTGDAIKSTNQTIQKSFEASDFKDLGKSIRGVNREIKQQVTHSFKVVTHHGGNPEKLLHCVQHANGDVKKIERCTRRF
jgi:hypothetical protein